MTPQERALVDDMFDRLAKLESAPRDPEAEQAIRAGLAKAPNALYALVQTVLVQDEALKRANERLRELEGDTAPDDGRPRGFLDNMRDALFGSAGAGRGGSVPSVPPRAPQQTYQQPAPYQQDTRGGMFGGGGGGSSFLGTAAAAAAGLIGGSLLLGGIRNMLGGGYGSYGNQGAFGSTFDHLAGPSYGGSSWSDAGGDLGRQAGLNDIGGGQSSFGDSGGSDSGGGFFDTAGNDSGFGGDSGGGFGGDSGGGGDSA